MKNQSRRSRDGAPQGVPEDRQAGYEAQDAGKQLQAPRRGVYKDVYDAKDARYEQVEAEELHHEVQ
jgi:hypothetical protein